MKERDRKLTVIALVAVLLLAVGFGTRMSIKAMSPVPPKLGLFYGAFKPCPQTPNCVSTQATRSEQKIEPISFVGIDRPAAYEILTDIINSLPRADVLVSRVDYIHVEFRSFWLGFRDDAEFALNDTSGKIEIRAAARWRDNDGGENRRRIESIRTNFNEKVKQLLKGS